MTQTRTARLATSVALLMGLSGVAGASAQEVQQDHEATEGRGWQVALWMKGGYQVSAGRMANNAASDAPDLRLLETVSELQPGVIYGGGVEVRVPGRDFTVRIGWETHRGGEVTGQVAVCELFSGPLCEPRYVPADIWALSGVARLVSGSEEKIVRPVISAGVGMRGFTFTPPECPPMSDDQLSLVCKAIVDLYQDPKPHAVLHIGAGVQASLNRMVVELGANAATGRYVGGSARTDGNWYHMVRFELSSSARVF